MKICYVSIPFGVKGGVDFDWVYRQVVMPAVQDAGLVCQRADELGDVALIQKSILQAVIAADVMIADVSNHNPNVMYELGIRHALRRGVTLLLSSDMLPFSISHSYALRYRVEPDGTILLDSAGQVREMLTVELRRRTERVEQVTNDSPIFEYFPSLRVELPEDLQPPGTRGYAYPSAAQARPSGRLDRKTDVARAEEVTRGTVNVDPQAYIDILKRYRDLSAWEDVVRFTESLPPEIRDSPQVVQTVVHALNRLGQVDRAIALLTEYIQETGGDAESFGLLGSIYKKRYFTQSAIGDLHEAIDQYRSGYDRAQQDLYLGRNLAMLLQRDDRASAPSQLATLLPEVRNLAEQKLATSPLPDYWDLESALILSVIARDWNGARQLVDRVLARKPETWILDATRDELSGMVDVLPTENEREQLHALLDALSQNTESDEEEDDA
jgi:tetratricopeptide (TPR) repeat protein